MSNFIETLEIKNFKSIRHLELSCGKINVLVGKPNVGKSNILEAISLLGAGYSDAGEKLLSEFIRYEDLRNLFYDQDTQKKIEVNTNIGSAGMHFLEGLQWYELFLGQNESVVQELSDSSHHDEDWTIESMNSDYADFSGAVGLWARGDGSDPSREIGANATVSPVRKYDFKKHEIPKSNTNSFSFLAPPNGSNLLKVLQGNTELRKEVGAIFKEYGLELVLDIQNNQLEIQKREDGIVTKMPYALVADTLRRYIFYFAAIASNHGGILVLEEPEAHSFPPYIRELAERIVEASADNQFFIATHSPYLLNVLIQETKPEDLRIWIASFENHETVVKQLSDDEISKLSDYGMDIFFNLNWFVNEGAEDIA